MGDDKRRSERIMLTIPLLAYGNDGVQNFKEEARTVLLNRHGARVHIRRPLQAGLSLHLVNQITDRGAQFRVIGPVTPFREKGGEYGVEFMNPSENIWAIQFPKPLQGEPVYPSALLECRKCHEVAMRHVSLVEVDVLETSGIIPRVCEKCDSSTQWGYQEKQIAMGPPPEESAMVAEVQAAARHEERRGHRRVTLHLPLSVRDYYGGLELTKTENASKTGCCFVSGKTYFVGQGIVVICPYSDGPQDLEISARIVRAPVVANSEKRIYGVRYEQR